MIKGVLLEMDKKDELDNEYAVAFEKLALKK